MAPTIKLLALLDRLHPILQECKSAEHFIVQIVVLDQGRVIESGTHAELLSRESKYADMWRRQATVDDTAHLLSAK